MLRHLDLFSGYGGFALAAGMVGGFETVAFCEIDPWCQRHLRRRWPGVPVYDDVRSIPRIDCDVLTAGFPCQDISHAGKRAGIEGERSGLWSFIPPIIRDLRPRCVLLENVTALLDRGLGRVLGDLAAIGYDAEWDCVGADALGATQHRERIWILAYPDDAGFQGPIWQGQPHEAREEWPFAHSEPLRSACGYWPPGPRAVDDIPRMADGPADRVHRLRALGSGIVPHVAALFLEAIRDALTVQPLAGTD